MLDKQTPIRLRLLPPAVFFLVTVALLLTGFFEFWRIVCLLVTYDLAAHVPMTILAQSFIEGLRFDFAVVSYLMLPFVAISLLPGIDIVRNKTIRSCVILLIVIVAALSFFAHLADIEFFNFFNARLNGTALLWQNNAGTMLSMLWETYPVIRYLLLYGIVLFAFTVCLRLLGRNVLVNQQPSRWWVNLLWIPILLLTFGLGARGRVEKMSPLRWGVAYFSEYNYANQLALNPVYTFLRDVFYDAGSRKRVEDMMQKIHFPEAEEITKEILSRPDEIRDTIERMHTPIRFDNPNQNPPNVIVIIMESFGSSHIGVLNNQTGQNISPQFDSLANQGTLFTNIYSTGMHTYAGLFSTLYGFSPGFGNLVLYSVPGYFHHSGLPQILKANGYHTFFMCPQDPHFDNMHGFLMDNGIDEVRSLFDCDPQQQLTIFGVPDHVMFDRAIELMRPQTSSKPLFATLLTCSFHGPWTIPDAPFEHVPDSVKDAKPLNAFKYSDWALGRFIRALEADSAFDNTLVVVTADNGAPWKPKLAMDLNQYQIPLLLYWIGNEKPEPQRLSTLGSQVDIVATVMGQLRLNWDNYTFGRDLLDSTVTNRFALCSEWRTLSCVEDNNYLIEELLDQKRSLYHLPDITTNYADTEPELAASLSLKARAIYQTGYFQMRKPIPVTAQSKNYLVTNVPEPTKP